MAERGVNRRIIISIRGRASRKPGSVLISPWSVSPAGSPVGDRSLILFY
jgi:hypothetical protein